MHTPLVSGFFFFPTDHVSWLKRITGKENVCACNCINVGHKMGTDSIVSLTCMAPCRILSLMKEKKR